MQVEPYAKWERVLKALEKYDQPTIAAYNIALAFILRFLQLAGKVRLADRTRRLEIMTNERRQREQHIAENEEKRKQKEERRQTAREEAQEKEEGFDE